MFYIREIKLLNTGKRSYIQIRRTNCNTTEEYYIRGCEYQEYKDSLIPKFIKQAKEQYNIDLSKNKFSWNQYFGCSCGCSPAFVIKGIEGLRFDILIDKFYNIYTKRCVYEKCIFDKDEVKEFNCDFCSEKKR